MKNKKIFLVVLGLFVLAFSLRIAGIDSHIGSVDEDLIARNTSNMLMRGEFKPDYFGWPGHSLMYILFFLMKFLRFVGLISGVEPLVRFAARTVPSQGPDIYLIGRALTASSYGSPPIRPCITAKT